ncbi:MAG: restriction endonuclease [Planctomycetaceae bacterium]|nr:restriction endonuclease [Planctomycetaceae bacterium]
MIKRSRVLISASSYAGGLIEKLAQDLRRKNFDVLTDGSGVEFGRSMAATIFSAVESSDYLVLLLQPGDSKYSWLREELNAALDRQLHKRDVTVIPVVFGMARVPSAIAHRTTFRIRPYARDAREIDRLVAYIVDLERIDLDHLTWKAFERLLADLLHKLRFKEIQLSGYASSGYDVKAVWRQRDPFGQTVDSNWIFEAKHYNQSRPDIAALRQMAGVLSNLPPDYYGAVVTSSQLTLSAQDWLKSYRESERKPIRIIDGPKLRDLIARYPDLVSKHFGQEEHK